MHPRQQNLRPTEFSFAALGRGLRAFAIAVFLLTTILIFNLLQLATLPLLLFSSAVFRRANRFLAGTWWGWTTFASETVCGVDVVFSGDDVPDGENALVLCNHQAMADVTVLMMLARRKGQISHLKWFVKDSLKYAPGMWGMFFLDCLFVKRNWASDSEKIRKTFGRFQKFKIPCWLVTFSEGTRLTPEKLAVSQNYSRAHGMPLLRHILVPRTKGFVASVEGLRGLLRAVYDVTIVYDEGIPNLWQFCQGRPAKIFVDVRRFPMETIPEERAEVSRWLKSRFVEKDLALCHFFRDRKFSS